MPTSTSRAVLRKPATSDNVIVGTDINDNMDQIDEHLGFFVCTSATRPTGSDRFTGRTILETDTNNKYYWTGTEWFLMNRLYVTKTAIESVSSITIQDDNHIFFSLTPGTWLIDAWLFCNGAELNDIDVAWSFSGTVTGSVTRGVQGPAGSGNDTMNTIIAMGRVALTSEQGYALDATDATIILIKEHIRIVVTGTGVLQLQWARNTNTTAGTPTDMTVDTHATAERVA